MWSIKYLIIAAILAISFEGAEAAWLEKRPAVSESQNAISDKVIKLARKRVRSRKSPRSKTRRSRMKKPAPKPTPVPAPAQAPQTRDMAVPLGSSLGRTTRIEFDAQLIKGQTTKAGEVQILERKDIALKSMVKRRTSFTEEIIHTVFPDKFD